MEVLLSSIAKNDLKLLMRVFNAEEKEKDKLFLEEIKNSVQSIVQISESLDIKSTDIQVFKTEKFPVTIHYIFEENDIIFITAIFRT